jgi:hypothetical protein
MAAICAMGTVVGFGIDRCLQEKEGSGTCNRELVFGHFRHATSERYFSFVSLMASFLFRFDTLALIRTSLEDTWLGYVDGRNG